MPDDKDDSERTPVEPIMARRRSSQQVLIGWRDCPSCVRDGVVDDRAECDLCWNEAEQRFNRKVPVDVYIRYIQDQAKKPIGYRDTEREMGAVKPEKKT